MHSHRRNRVDENDPELVRQIRQLPGVMVLKLGGTADLLIGAFGKNYLVDVKRDHKAKLTDAQKRLREEWTGQFAIVTCLDDVLRLLNAP